MNDRMETSVPDIYAAGDAVQVKHYVTGNDALISLAGPANKQGRIIADNICGGDSRYLGSQDVYKRQEGLCGTRNHDFMHSIVCIKWFPAFQELF